MPAEDPAGPSEFHRAGQSCVVCHSEYEGAEPEMAIGGTIYQANFATLQLQGVEGVFVTIYDSNGATQKACTNAVGNFYVELEDWRDAAFPMSVQVGNRFMRSLIGRERSCAGCHVLPTPSRVANAGADPFLGVSRDSAGAIIVEPDQIPITERCGLGAQGQGGGGGAGGAGGATGGGGGAGGAGGGSGGSGGAGGAGGAGGGTGGAGGGTGGGSGGGGGS